MQCLRIDDVIPILSTVVLVGVLLKDSFGGTTLGWVYKVY